MARKKKNKNSQTFDVYPYLDQYQYLMRNGGALPWYQTEGPKDKPIKPDPSDEKYINNSNQYVIDLEAYEDSIEEGSKEGSKEGSYTCNGKPCGWPAYREHHKKMTGSYPPDSQGPDYEGNEDVTGDIQKVDKKEPKKPRKGINFPLFGKNKAGQTFEEAQTQYEKDLQEFESEVPNAAPMKTEEQIVRDEKIMSDFKKENNISDDWDDWTEENTKAFLEYEQKIYEEEQKLKDEEEFPIGSKEEEIIEETDEEEIVVKSEYDQAVKDYQDGKISRRELDELTLRYNLGDGMKTGNTQFETKPGSAWSLLGKALGSTNKVIDEFGQNRINPKTGKPYEKSDFQKSSFDWSNLSNENKANIYFDEENLKKFTSGEGDDLKVSDVFKTKTMNEAENFNKFQEERTKLTEEGGQENLFSKQSMDRITGDITYDDITEDVLSKTKNPAYIEAIQLIPKDQPLEGHPSLKDIPEYLTESQTREHTDADLTSGDLAKDHLKDMSVTDIIFDKEGNAIKYKGFGTEGSGEGSTGTWEYDKDKKYGDWEETITSNEQEELNNLQKGLNRDGSDPNAVDVKTDVDGPKEVSRVTNEDFSVTITYDDGSEKTMNEGSQEQKNRIREENKNNKKGGEMGLKTFVYGGQPSKEKLSFTDMYAKGGDVLKWYGAGDETENEEDLKETNDANETPVIVEEPCPDPGTCVDPQTWNPNTCACQEDYDDEINFSAEEIALMDEEVMSDTDLIESETTYGKGTQGIKNRWGSFTKAGTSGKIMNTYGNFGQAAADWADFGVAVTDTWANDASRKKAEMEGNTAADMFVTQESNQGIHDINSGDRWTNKKVDEIYSGNTMKGPLIVQQGGDPQQMAQPVPIEENLDYSALAQFEGNNVWDSEVSYSPEVIAYQKKIMGKMKNGGQLPGYQNTGEKKKVHDFLEYHPNYPRTSVVDYTEDFTETELRDAITRDSTIIENDLANSWIYRNIIGQDQTHQSNFGPAGKLQLNREWLYKLINSNSTSEGDADNLNFYKRGGQLPMAQEGWWDKLKTKATETWENTDFKTSINKALDYTQTTLSTAGLTPAIGIIPDAINTAISTGRTGHAAITGDMEAAKKYGTSLALNAGSMIPIAGQAFGVTSIANDAKNYASTDTPTITTPSAQIAENRNEDTKKIGQTSAKDGGEQEVEVDYEILQELIKAGADIEII